MALETFGTGWRDKFEKRLESLKKMFPELRIERIERFSGMLRISVSALDPDVDYIAKCVVYKIERDSAKTCEMCGKTGLRRLHDEVLTVGQCLCTLCYATELDRILTQHTN